ncbi:pilus assembly protein FlpE [Isoptericola sp. b490]|uniref:pilus assembly protein FlpE n=1 Tax=Actinotalea lenta TaxID=3064654 RepID=UPI0027130EFE|nr:pilus assembly protein FlpE [Isoptericola sp. b490]MDO8121761.1 pilus assembly protein FlpE [Isoptericola sp. b490]
MSGVVVVAGATGGAGASTFAALLARTWARGDRADPVVLLDLGAGAGLEVTLGIERRPGARWPAFDGLRGYPEPDELLGALPRWRGVDVLSAERTGAMPTGEVVTAVLGGLRAGRAGVVVDLAAGRLDSDAAHAATCGAEVVLLAGQDVRGVAGLLAARERHPGPARLVLRRRRSTVAPLEAAHVADLPLLGLLPTDRRIADAADRGLGPEPGRRLRRAVLRIAGRLGP